MEGYSYVLATVGKSAIRRSSLNRTERVDVSDDPQLCLCLDSNYADDVHLPYGLEAGDKVYLA